MFENWQIKSACNKAADEIPAEFLQQLGQNGRRFLLALCNASWQQAVVPRRWRQAIIVPLLKAGKDPTDPGSYRPVSLTSVVGKVCDKLVQRRMMQLLEAAPGRLRPRQAGFRPRRTAEEQAASLSARVSDGFAQGQVTLAVLLDHKGAFNKAWRAGTVHKLVEKGVPLRMVRWLDAFMAERVARVRWGTSLSEWRPMREGIAQGTVSAPTLFGVLVDDLPEVELQFADDALVVVQAKTEAECVELMNEKLRAVSEWVQRWRLPLNLGKCEWILFEKRATQRAEVSVRAHVPAGAEALSFDGLMVTNVAEGGLLWRGGLRPGMRVQQVGTPAGFVDAEAEEGRRALAEELRAARATGRLLRLRCVDYPAVRVHGVPIGYSANPKYLGVRYDSQLKFDRHIELLADRMDRQRRVLAGLAGTAWGCTARTLRLTYQATTLAAVEYASAAWRPYAAQGAVQRLEVAHNKACRLITGCLPKTRTEVVLSEAGMPPMWVRAERLVATARERFQRLGDDCPARRMEPSIPRTRLDLRGALRGHGVEPFADPGAIPSWEGTARVRFHAELLYEVAKESEAFLRRAAVEETLAERGDMDWEGWTDGSLSASAPAGTCARTLTSARWVILQRKPAAGGPVLVERARFSEPAGAVTSSYAAEMRAIRAALRRLRALLPAAPARVLLATDSQAAVRALAAGPATQSGEVEQDVWRLIRALFGEGSGRELVVQWVSSHCELKWNDAADECARLGAQMPQQDVPVSFASAAAAVRRAAGSEWAARRHAVFEEWRQREQRQHWYVALPRPPRRRGDAGGDDEPAGGASGGWHSVVALLRRRMPRRVERVVGADYQSGMGWAPTCVRCGAPADGVEHLLLVCTHEKVRRLREEHLGRRPTLAALTREFHRLEGFVAGLLKLYDEEKWIRIERDDEGGRAAAAATAGADEEAAAGEEAAAAGADAGAAAGGRRGAAAAAGAPHAQAGRARERPEGGGGGGAARGARRGARHAERMAAGNDEEIDVGDDNGADDASPPPPVARAPRPARKPAPRRTAAAPAAGAAAAAAADAPPPPKRRRQTRTAGAAAAAAAPAPPDAAGAAAAHAGDGGDDELVQRIAAQYAAPRAPGSTPEEGVEP
eukprot:gene5350-2167_t